jgi:hypothetical protein
MAPVSATDPLATVWAALERGGHGPHGQPHDFRAPCPRHDGENSSALHISIGADGRALLHCFVCQAPAEEIAEALGLSASDLFPSGHHRARRYQLPEARRPDFTGKARALADFLAGLERIGAAWSGTLRFNCPHCGSPAAQLYVPERFPIVYSCPGDGCAEALGFTGCTLDQARQALAGRLSELA